MKSFTTVIYKTRNIATVMAPDNPKICTHKTPHVLLKFWVKVNIPGKYCRGPNTMGIYIYQYTYFRVQ